jgi:hypothetical protein
VGRAKYSNGVWESFHLPSTHVVEPGAGGAMHGGGGGGLGGWVCVGEIQNHPHCVLRRENTSNMTKTPGKIEMLRRV